MGFVPNPLDRFFAVGYDRAHVPLDYEALVDDIYNVAFTLQELHVRRRMVLCLGRTAEYMASVWGARHTDTFPTIELARVLVAMAESYGRNEPNHFTHRLQELVAVMNPLDRMRECDWALMRRLLVFDMFYSDGTPDSMIFAGYILKRTLQVAHGLGLVEIGELFSAPPSLQEVELAERYKLTIDTAMLDTLQDAVPSIYIHMWGLTVADWNE
ncbi:ORF78 [Ranid herpesvirus 1]|uniref:ORF78 n=1 Tax=Ranid herpesvirus 1 TaxID=85655 RepID=Q9YQZ0_9VIRU|nr:ORF78 [Ranid herpesvirus 1]AAD12275.1 ORF78 [Ranid herpesvirus 1]